VLIFDEVVTGFRMSKGGAQALYGVTPDMCTLAKILGGGLPGGAVTGKAEIIDMIQLRDEPGFNSASRIGHNGTFNANPLSAAAGQKALELVKTQPINANADRAATRLRDGLNGLLNRMEITGTATGVASAVFLRLGVEVDPHDDEVVLTEAQERTASDPVKKDQLTLAMYNHGVDGGPRFLVSAIHSDDDIDQTVEVTGRALADMREQGLV
jgi:glutamate-1-semialdehyde 2,1-aminomutase